MKTYVKLYNVRDTRTDRIHSVVVVEEKKAKYFVPVEEEQEEE